MRVNFIAYLAVDHRTQVESIDICVSSLNSCASNDPRGLLCKKPAKEI